MLWVSARDRRLTVLAALAVGSIATPWQPRVAIAAVAVAGSLIRIPFAWWAMLRCRRTIKDLRRIGRDGPIGSP